MNEYQQYAGQLKATLDRLPWRALEATADMLNHARLERRQVFVLGNGGSAATASHMACDLGKNTVFPGQPRFRVIALTDNMATFSALANDAGYENVFAEQLANLVQADDVVVGISTSGNSPNVLRAIELARREGAQTIAWTGAPGGMLAQIAHLPVVVENDCIEQVEDIHLVMEHMLTVALRRMVLAMAQPLPIPTNGVVQISGLKWP